MVGGKQVALHRSLTNLLHVAEMRPINWRRYCAISWSSKYPPRQQGDTAAAATAGTETPAGGNVSVCSGEEGDLLSQFGDLPPVCILFALCENGGGRGQAGRGHPGIGASELQPLIWQLLELTLRPEYHHHVAGGMPPPPLPHPMAAPVSLLRGSSGGGGSGDPEGSSKSGGAVVVAGTNASSGGQGDRLVPAAGGGAAAAAMAEGSALGVGVGAWSSPSPADLLIAKGLVGSDAVVEMAQDLLSPAADAEARQRTSSVLHHLWASSAAESRPEV